MEEQDLLDIIEKFKQEQQLNNKYLLIAKQKQAVFEKMKELKNNNNEIHKMLLMENMKHE